jgi:sterol 3beta-glucosyltransferase
MVGSDPEETMTTVLDAIRQAKVRAIFASGWGGIKHAALPDTVFPVESVPHEWLFPQCAAAVHHGGAGTTAATLRAGVPSVVVPYFYDQFFWGKRLRELGVASRPIPQKKLTSEALAAAIREVVGSPEIGSRCRRLAESISRENGVQAAVDVLQRYLGAMMRRITQ